MITDVIINAAKTSIPNKYVNIRPNDVPWFQSNIRKLIRQRKRLHKKAKIINSDLAWAIFRKKRNDVTTAIRKCKSDFKENLIKKINESSLGAKNWFKMAKSFLKLNKQSNKIPTLINQNVEASTDTEKATLLNDFFSQQSTVDDLNKNPPTTTDPPIATLSNIHITPQDVIDALSKVDPSKACGPDLISPRLLKEALHELSVPLSTFFNLLLLKSYFPKDWKKANCTPIFKKADPSDPSNYRPISLLSCIGKVMECCVHKYLYNHLINHNLLSPYQSGFVAGDSTTNQLVLLYNEFCKGLDEGKEVRLVFSDISKAFDRVWHSGLLQKLTASLVLF